MSRSSYIVLVTGSCGYNWFEQSATLAGFLLKITDSSLLLLGEPYVARMMAHRLRTSSIEFFVISRKSYPEGILKMYSKYRVTCIIFAFRAGLCGNNDFRGYMCSKCEYLYIKPGDLVYNVKPHIPVIAVYKHYPEVGSSNTDGQCHCPLKNHVELSLDDKVYATKNYLVKEFAKTVVEKKC